MAKEVGEGTESHKRKRHQPLGMGQTEEEQMRGPDMGWGGMGPPKRGSAAMRSPPLRGILGVDRRRLE